MGNRFDKLQRWTLQWTDTKWGTWALFVCAFADASVLPMPTPMFFVGLSLLNIQKAYIYALYGTVGSLAGAIAGYLIGHYAWLDAEGEFSALAQFVVTYIPGFSEAIYNSIQLQYEKWDFGILFIASLLPVPYKLFSISSGVFNINIIIFSIATLLSQALKFYLLALLVIKLGPKMKALLSYKIKPVVYIMAVCIILGVIAIKLL